MNQGYSHLEHAGYVIARGFSPAAIQSGGGALWLLRGHCRQGIDGEFWSPLPERCPAKMLQNPCELVFGGGEAIGHIEPAKRSHAVDPCCLHATHAGQFELRRRGVARQPSEIGSSVAPAI